MMNGDYCQIGSGQTGWTRLVRLVVCVRSDRQARGLTGCLCVGFSFGLLFWISVIIICLLLLDIYYVYARLLCANNKSS